MYPFVGKQTARIIATLLVFAVAFAHVYTDGKNEGKLEEIGVHKRDKRMIEYPSVKLGVTLGKLVRFLPYYFRAKRARKILIANAKLVKTETHPRGAKLTMYEKQGGCERAVKDFDLTDTANTRVLVGTIDHSSQRYEGTVGSYVIQIIGYTSGCEIRMGRRSTAGRGSSDSIVVTYPGGPGLPYAPQTEFVKGRDHLF